MAKATSQPLYLITDGGKLRQKGKLVAQVERALEGAGGLIGFVQLREQHAITSKSIGVPAARDEDIVEISERLLPVCRAHRAKLLISRRTDLVLLCGADGVHFGSDVELFQDARKTLGSGKFVGCSAHTAADIKMANELGYDYVLYSPIFKPLSKSIVDQPVGLQALRKAAETTEGLLFALGGITAENTLDCLMEGASGVATLSAILLSEDPFEAARHFAEAIRNARQILGKPLEK